MKNWRKFFALFGLFLVLLIGVGFLVKMVVENGVVYGMHDYHGVPIIEISLNGVDLAEVDGNSKEIKYGGNELEIYDGRSIQNLGVVEVKGRGNGTWVQDKKPYQIKFARKMDLFGMGKARKWYLLANAMDDTNLRTEVAFELARMLGMKYGFEGKFVELYVDGDYRGLYYLTRAMEIGKGTVDLKNPLGVLVELDNLYWEQGIGYITGKGDTLTVKDTVVDSNEKIAMTSFVQAFNELEVAIDTGNYERVVELADMESFAQYYLLSEFTVNPDAYWTSFYFYKDGPEDKIHAGPGWDFDLALGNRKWGNWLGELFYSTTEKMVRRREVHPDDYSDLGGSGINENEAPNNSLSEIVFKMMEMPEFRKVVAVTFQEKMSGREAGFIADILRRANAIVTSAKADGTKWVEDYDFWTEVKKMVEWVHGRYRYFEREYGRRTEHEA